MRYKINLFIFLRAIKCRFLFDFMFNPILFYACSVNFDTGFDTKDTTGFSQPVSMG
jgi:hypothetical protein